MKYELELELNLPREKVVALFDNQDNLKRWQPELLSFVHIDGEKGKEGAKSKLRYKMGKREVEMTETIVVRKPPDVFSAIYEAKGVWNRVDNRFDEKGEQNTNWWVASEFKSSGFLKIMSILFPGMFKKQTMKYMKQFKAFAENSG